jgi:hypothetical protein
VKIVEHVPNAMLLEFGNEMGLDNVGLSLSRGRLALPYLFIFEGSREIITTISSLELNLNEWTHLAAVYDGEYGILFINGREVSSSEFSSRGPRNVTRNQCFIGKSSPNAYFDEIRIYNVALSPSEIFEIIESKTTTS